MREMNKSVAEPHPFPEPARDLLPIGALVCASGSCISAAVIWLTIRALIGG
jgi:hypothetical protein